MDVKGVHISKEGERPLEPFPATLQLARAKKCDRRGLQNLVKAVVDRELVVNAGYDLPLVLQMPNRPRHVDLPAQPGHVFMDLFVHPVQAALQEMGQSQRQYLPKQVFGVLEILARHVRIHAFAKRLERIREHVVDVQDIYALDRHRIAFKSLFLSSSAFN